jgi:hypothetical protein
MIAKTEHPASRLEMDAFSATALLLLRMGTILLCFVALQVVTFNHFLYTLLKGRYLNYQIWFYVVLFAASLLVSVPWNVSRGKWLVVLLMCAAGYLSSWIAFFLEPTMRYGLSSSRSPFFYRELFAAALLSFGWLLGGLVGTAIVTLERYFVIRAQLN